MCAESEKSLLLAFGANLPFSGRPPEETIVLAISEICKAGFDPGRVGRRRFTAVTLPPGRAFAGTSFRGAQFSRSRLDRLRWGRLRLGRLRLSRPRFGFSPVRRSQLGQAPAGGCPIQHVVFVLRAGVIASSVARYRR